MTGCPIDLDFDVKQPEARGHGWLADYNRPTLTLTTPRTDAGLTHFTVSTIWVSLTLLLE